MKNSPLCLAAAFLTASPVLAENDPLPSWNEGDNKSAIIAFVESATEDGSPAYVDEDDRIAVFDNDGTLWAEQPAYFQLLFAIDRVKAMADMNPDWQTTEPYASILKDDLKSAFPNGTKDVLKVVAATHARLTTDQFAEIVRDWLETARHPTTDKPYTEMVYQPMLELLAYLRDEDFKTFIVSGGGIDFMRVFAEDVYGVPPEYVVGSSIEVKFDIVNGAPMNGGAILGHGSDGIVLSRAA